MRTDSTDESRKTNQSSKRLLIHQESLTVKRLITDQIEREMYEMKLSKKALADKMNTSRAALDRLLDPENIAVTLNTLGKIAYVLNKRLEVKFE